MLDIGIIRLRKLERLWAGSIWLLSISKYLQHYKCLELLSKLHHGIYTLLSPFTARLKQARSGKGLSQKKLGILAGLDEFVASSRMNHYETGRHAPEYEMVKQIADVLELPVAYFYCEEDWLAEDILTAWINRKEESVANKIVEWTNDWSGLNLNSQVALAN